MSKPTCPKHHCELVCPQCRSSKGGKTTAKRHSSAELSRWGKMGGRPKKEKD